MSSVPRLALSVLLGLATACTVTPVGELTASECSNRGDDDRDGLIDCKDPDCLMLAVCRDPAFPDGIDSGQVPMVDTDSGVEPPPPPPSDAGPLDASLDGGTPMIDATAPCTVSSCMQGESCVNGVCVPDMEVTGSTYLLSIDSAVVPQLGGFGMCLDICGVAEFVVCPCQPDPYVVVTLRRDGQTTTVDVTDWVSDTTQPYWTDERSTVELKMGDELFFQAFDYDPDNEDPEILRCKPDLGQVPTGSLVCGSTAGHIDATITPLN